MTRRVEVETTLRCAVNKFLKSQRHDAPPQHRRVLSPTYRFQTWSGGSFEAEDDGGAAAEDWGDGGIGEDMEGTGGGVVGTLKKIYSLFGGGDD